MGIETVLIALLVGMVVGMMIGVSLARPTFHN
jgi:hypothetical protein